MNTRDRILSNIADVSSSASVPVAPQQKPPIDLWAEFWTKLEALGGRKADRSALAGKAISAEPATGLTSNAGVWDSEIGVSRAILAVAETGTLIFASGPGYERLSSLAPPVNFVLISADAIVATLDEAVARMPARNSVWVTGPSRTADIEGILVRGVHGPGELLVCVEDCP